MSSVLSVVSSSLTITSTSSRRGTSAALSPTTHSSLRSIGRSRTYQSHRLASRKRPFKPFLNAQPRDSNRTLSLSSCASSTILRIQPRMEWFAPRTQAAALQLRIRSRQRPPSRVIQLRIRQKKEELYARSHQGNRLRSFTSVSSKLMRVKRAVRLLSWVEYPLRRLLRPLMWTTKIQVLHLSNSKRGQSSQVGNALHQMVSARAA